jgi:hypothetical protein
MKNHRRLPAFVGGMLIAVLIYATAATALAASGAVTFNAASLFFNGTEVLKKGEPIKTASGASIPATIRYTDDTGGSTTYVPIRNVAETLQMPIAWDAASGTATMRADGDLQYYARLYTTPSASAEWTMENVMKEVKPIIPLGGTTVLAPVNHQSAEALTADAPLTSENGRYVSVTVTNHNRTPVEFGLGNRNAVSRSCVVSQVPAGGTVTRTMEVISPEGQPYAPLYVFVGYSQTIPWTVNVTVSAVQFKG